VFFQWLAKTKVTDTTPIMGHHTALPMDRVDMANGKVITVICQWAVAGFHRELQASRELLAEEFLMSRMLPPCKLLQGRPRKGASGVEPGQ
jgi:hypothetical protein